ncbi:replication initiation and membrane attachment family protein [Macrococcus sp. DPC7161]|uniref:replication initiation and membrane attachment family protein n=1 Tax=Macrococcus sp. DPC7161 TaxID=2507060 RepID=UPI00100ACA79|nr:DnaD domain protein [Macrococcus sp. DPC7161]RXK18213.1 hypothetical protein ER639_05860 [Macrococcus sp. DPC7161]
MNYYKSLQPADKFVVTSNYVQTHFTKDVLNTLYAPLIGLECIGLYHYLGQFLDDFSQKSSGHTHYLFLNELHFNLQHFEALRKKLEAIGLLKTYITFENETIEYVYKCISPVLPDQFFNDPMLTVFLYQQVGQSRFQTLKQRYITEQIDYSNYRDVSSKYMDVFAAPKKPEKHLFHDNMSLLKNSASYGIPIHQETFDFDMLEMLLNEHLISKSQLDKKTRQLITQLAMLYNLGPVEMKQIVLKALTANQTISHEDLRKNARDYYTIEHDGALPSLQVASNQQADHLEQSSGKKASSLLNWFEYMDTTSPVEMLTGLFEAEPTLKQKRMIENLLERERLPFGVVNVLLQYVLLTNDRKLPQAYIEEIASNWKKLNLKSAKEAYEYSKKIEQKKKQQNNKNYYQKSNGNAVNSIEKTPKWLTDKQLSNAKNEKQNLKKENAETKQTNVDEVEKLKLLKQLDQMWEED